MVDEKIFECAQPAEALATILGHIWDNAKTPKNLADRHISTVQIHR